jgi:integrase/recombinase XerD
MSFPNAADWQIFDANGCRKYLNNTEREAILAEADRCAPVTRALCYFLTYTGCRISEALELGPARLDAEMMSVTLRTLKRRRLTFRRIPIPEHVMLMLLALPRAPCGRLFGMHRSTAWRQLSAIMERTNVFGPMATCRGFRHGYGIQAISSGVPAPLLQRLLGHADIATTLIYVDAVGADERKLVSRMWQLS